jgi:predicted restriction endonuclease
MSKVTQSNVLAAFKSIKANGVPPRLKSTKYDVIFENQRFPPKVVMRQATKIAAGGSATDYSVYDKNGEAWWGYGGGKATNNWLIDLGFQVVSKKGDYKDLRKTWEKREESTADGYLEGEIEVINAERRHRDPKARAAALKNQGYDCQVCGFNFERVYGVVFAEVHHLKPLARGHTRNTDPSKDLLVVCCNCHAMLHPSAKEVKDWTILKESIKIKE